VTSGYGFGQWSGTAGNTTYYPTWWQSGSSVGVIDVTSLGSLAPISVQRLPGVMESPAIELSDREWLDAQIAEVCALA
jgi:hypothetical protein